MQTTLESRSNSNWQKGLVFAPFFLWGTAMVVMKGVMPQTQPLFVGGMRLLPAGLILLLVAALTGREPLRGWRAWGWVALFGLVDGTLFQGFLVEGLARTGAGLGSVLIDSQPLAVALMAFWLYGERIGRWGWLGLALGVFGISLIGLPDSFLRTLLSGQWTLETLPETLQFTGGEWLMLMAALSMAVGTILIRPVCRYVDPVVATGWHMVLGSVPLFGLSTGLETEVWQHLNWHGWLGITYMALLGSAAAYGLFFYYAAQGNLTTLSSLTFLTPVFALLFGKVFLAEALTNLQWGGVGLTLISIYLVNQREILAERSNEGPSQTLASEHASEPVMRPQLAEASSENLLPLEPLAERRPLESALSTSSEQD
ncbi:DMT family transporter [Leptolyngbya sp. FACHB-261]|uniref:DMT family transporter n=1 Tax=Leptolyngbya sp. FACHB-261 TaxID=2692806 RepID=UPI0016896B7C|nr:DMT family transporter [Leptolyngbya sp. FACHB-261]MBD2099543.1 DMT family transporter [Leptolyngbya sp. FACHB-261]